MLMYMCIHFYTYTVHSKLGIFLMTSKSCAQLSEVFRMKDFAIFCKEQNDIRTLVTADDR